MAGKVRLTFGQPVIPLRFGSSPALARTIADLAPYSISDLDAYTIGMLDQSQPVKLVFGGGQIRLMGGFPTATGIIEALTNYTIADLGTLTIAELANL